MSKEEIFSKVVEIFRDVFDDWELNVSYSSNSKTIQDWDSLAHINLVTAIEKEFDVRFTIVELTSLNDVGEMIDLVFEKI